MHLQYFLCNTTWNSIKIIFLYGRYYKYDTEIEYECESSPHMPNITIIVKVTVNLADYRQLTYYET